MSRAKAVLEIRAEAPDALDALALADLWNSAWADDMPTSARLLAWALYAHAPRSVAVWIASQKGHSVGFVVASYEAGRATGWVDALAVAAHAEGDRIRTALLDAAAAWLSDAGCTTMQVGGGVRSLMRGVLQASALADFLRMQGYADAGHVLDMQVDVARYAPPHDAPEFAGVVRPALPRDRDDVDALLGAGTALYSAAMGTNAEDAQLLLVNETVQHGRLADLMLLWSARGLEGLSLLIFADSAVPLDLAYPYALPRAWTALGPVLLRHDCAAGAAGMLLDASLRRLHNNGANSCVTMQVRERALYADYGFVPLRTWSVFVKRLQA